MQRKKVNLHTIVGEVASNSMEKTLVVKIERLKKHPKYNKYYKIRKKIQAHFLENEKVAVGEKVKLKPTKPFSKNKKWEVVEIIK